MDGWIIKERRRGGLRSWPVYDDDDDDTSEQNLERRRIGGKSHRRQTDARYGHDRHSAVVS